MKKIFLLPLLLFANSLFAGQVKNDAHVSYNNPHVIVMVLIIFILLAFIVVLNYSLSSLVKMKMKNDKHEKSSNPKIISIIILLIIPSFLNAQQIVENRIVEEVEDGLTYGMDTYTFYTLLSVIIVELLIIFAQILMVRGFVKHYLPQPDKKVKIYALKPSFWDRFNKAVELEKETEIMFSHEYDGIRELDNDLPPWWKYGFYFTVLFAFAYLIHYHIAKSGPLQEVEYKTEIVNGNREVAEYLKNEADNVDEGNVVMLKGEDLNQGKSIFSQNCVACHGDKGQGKVGPNLTDDYWIHGGSVKDVFISVKYGWPDKGMKLWKDDLTPKEMAQVTSYVKSLRGTNPPGALPPKGELYKEK